MITSILGLPGGGKSYETTVRILDELRTTERYIVTNVPLRLDNILKLFIKEGRGDIDVYGRVQFLEHEEVTNYWRFRGPGVDPLPAISKQEQKDGVRPKIEWFQDKRPVAYFLDEWHEHCNSRTWQINGEINFWYAAKHRHWGDDLTWISQSPANVDKQFRSITAEYVRCRNFGYEMYKGFRKGNHCIAETFLGPDLPVETSTVQSFKRFQIEPKTVGTCYYTSLAKGAADTKRKAKGLSIVWLYGGIVVTGLLVWVVITQWATVANWYFGLGKKQSVPSKPAAVAIPSPTVTPSRHVSGIMPSVAPQVEQARVSATPTPKPMMILAVPLKFVTAEEAIAAVNGRGVSTGEVAQGGAQNVVAVPNATNDAVLVSSDDLQRATAFAQTIRNYDQQARLVTVNAVVGRLVHGKSDHVGLYDLLRSASQSTGQSGSVALSALLAGMTYDLSTGLATFGSSIAARDALAVITDFEARGYRFEVVSRPSITTISGREGTFGTGREIPLPETVSDAAGTRTSVQYKTADFSFTIKPTLKPDGTVRLVIDQKNSDVLSSAEIGGNPVPTLSTQNLRTIIDLRPDQVAYLGGIKVRTKTKERRGVPVLKDIPVVNLVFGTKEAGEEESELVVLVTVDLHRPDDPPRRVMRAIPVKATETGQWNDDTATLQRPVSAQKAP